MCLFSRLPLCCHSFSRFPPALFHPPSFGSLPPKTPQLKGETVKLTNAEWMDLTYPENEHVPYMYDEFSLDHCT